MEKEKRTRIDFRSTFLAVLFGIIAFFLGLILFFPGKKITTPLLDYLRDQGHIVKPQNISVNLFTGTVHMQGVSYEAVSLPIPVKGLIKEIRLKISPVNYLTAGRIKGTLSIENPFLTAGPVELQRANISFKFNIDDADKKVSDMKGKLELNVSDLRLSLTEEIPFVGKDLKVNNASLKAKADIQKGYVRLTPSQTSLESSLVRAIVNGSVPLIKSREYDLRTQLYLLPALFQQVEGVEGMLKGMKYMDDAGMINLEIKGRGKPKVRFNKIQ